MSDNIIEEFVKVAMKNVDITDYNIEIEGKANKEDGYLGNIFFVTVSGSRKNGSHTSLNLAIKLSKNSQQVTIKEAFAKEIHVYDNVKSEFKRLQQENTSENLLDFIPQCYGTQMSNNTEMLIFENLKPKGFNLCNKMIPMPYDNVKLVLEAYGKWHAFSFALKNKHPERFENLITNNKNMFSQLYVQMGLIDLTVEHFENARKEIISGNSQNELIRRIKFSKSDIKHIIVDSFFEDVSDQVILHGDCWNNNFMFKYGQYGKENEEKPLNVRIIDWQLSGLGSPVMDLSQLIYFCCDTGTYKNVEEFLKIYHNSLSQTLKLLGCEVNAVFPYNKLLKHWKKYSAYGIILCPFQLKLVLCDAEDTPDLADAAEQGKQFLDNFNFEVKDREGYLQRIKNNFVHFVENTKYIIKV